MPPLRIVSYNVRYFGHALRGVASTRGTMQRIARALAELTPVPDIICLQEVETLSLRSSLMHREPGSEPQISRLLQMLNKELADAGKPAGYQAYYFPAHRYRITASTAVYTTGLSILAHPDLSIQHENSHKPHDITHRGTHLISGLKQTRICAHLRFVHRCGSTIDVFNTHLSLPNAIAREFWTGRMRMGFGKNQLQEARNLMRFIEEERASDRYVVVGDFNSIPGSPVYRFLSEEHGMRDAFAHHCQMTEEELLRFPTAGFMHLRMHLDHIFSGPALKWLDFDGTEPYGWRTAEFHGLSDHMPLIGRCLVAPEKSS